jgi:hypothetical protein
MVYGTADRDPFPGENLWLDVPSGQSRGNWVPTEGQVLATVLDELAMHGVKTEDIRVISPFRDVVRGSKDIGRRAFGRAFANKNVGTVHTVQGQEADVIVLVLGSAPGQRTRPRLGRRETEPAQRRRLPRQAQALRHRRPRPVGCSTLFHRARVNPRTPSGTASRSTLEQEEPQEADVDLTPTRPPACSRLSQRERRPAPGVPARCYFCVVG